MSYEKWEQNFLRTKTNGAVLSSLPIFTWLAYSKLSYWIRMTKNSHSWKWEQNVLPCPRGLNLFCWHTPTYHIYFLNGGPPLKIISIEDREEDITLSIHFPRKGSVYWSFQHKIVCSLPLLCFPQVIVYLLGWHTPSYHIEQEWPKTATLESENRTFCPFLVV